jgi:hypothetical protein
MTKLYNSNGLPLVHDDDAMLGSYEREDLMLPMMGDVSVGTKKMQKIASLLCLEQERI